MSEHPMPDWGAMGGDPDDLQVDEKGHLVEDQDGAPLPDETPRARAARELLLARHLTNMVKAHEATKAAAAGALFTKVKQQEPAELDGANLGAVRVDAGASSWTCTDHAALLAWVKEAAPGEVQLEVPADELQRIVHAAAAVVDQYAVPCGGPDGDQDSVESTEPEDVWRLFRDLRAALQPNPVRVKERVSPTYEEALLGAARSGKDVLHQRTGEDVPARSLPFLTKEQAPSKLVVTVSKDEDGQAAQAAIIGRLGAAAQLLGLQLPELES